MGIITKRIRTGCLLLCSVINAVLPILQVSNTGIPPWTVISGNIVCSLCLAFYTRADDIEKLFEKHHDRVIDSIARVSSGSPSSASSHTSQINLPDA